MGQVFIEVEERQKQDFFLFFMAEMNETSFVFRFETSVFIRTDPGE